jgi:tRNA (guanine-N7-)-methyltransferase
MPSVGQTPNPAQTGAQAPDNFPSAPIHDEVHFTSATAPSTGRGGRSFRTRMGRMSDTKHRAFDEILPVYQVRPTRDGDFDAIFNRRAPLVLDIGFGMGHSTIALAQARPDWNILAIDVHVAGLAMLASQLDELRISNVRIIPADAHEILLWMVPPDSVLEAHIWFSDPWPKNGQSWRRLVQLDFLTLLTSRLATGGLVRMATDWQPYADQMMHVIEQAEGLENVHGSRAWAPRDSMRPLTAYERHGIAAGRIIRDLVAVKH